MKPVKFCLKDRQAEIGLRLARFQLDGLPEVDNGFPEFLTLGVDLPQLIVNGGVLRLEALSFLERGLGGVELPAGQRFQATLKDSPESVRRRSRGLPEEKEKQYGCNPHAEKQ